MKERIIKKICNNLDVGTLKVINVSHLHKGHKGHDGGSDTHFEVEVFSEDLINVSLVKAHKIINNLLMNEFKEGGLHALSIKILKNNVN